MDVDVCWSARICLLLHVVICSLRRGLLHVGASGLCSLRRGFRYIEVLFHTCYCYFGRARVSFVILRTSLYRGSLNRRSTVFDYNVKKAHPYSGTEWKLDKWFSLKSAPLN